MADSNDNDKSKPANRWLSSIRAHPAIAIVIVVVTVVGAAASFLTNVKDILGLFPSDAAPKVVSLSLSPSAVGFQETTESLFASGDDSLRTFGPINPPVSGASALLLVTVMNPLEEDVAITQVSYDVDQVGQVKGGPAGPVNSLATYKHVLRHQTGSQSNRLIPPFNIPSKQSASFELQLVSGSLDVGLGWLLRLQFESSGGSFESDKFQLYLPKPELAEGGAISGSPISNNGSVSILERRTVQVDLPNPTFRDCIFGASGISTELDGLDHLDKDMLFMRAKMLPFSELLQRKPETVNAAYTDLVDTKKLERLAMIVKTSAFGSCSQ